MYVTIIIIFSVPCQALFGRRKAESPPVAVENQDDDTYDTKAGVAFLHDGDDHFSLVESLNVVSQTDEAGDASDILQHLLLHPKDGTVLEDIEDVDHGDLPMDANMHHAVLKSMCQTKGFDSDDCHVAASAALNARMLRAENESVVANHHYYKSIISSVAVGFLILVSFFLLIVKFTECGSELRRMYSTHVAARRVKKDSALKDMREELEYFEGQDPKYIDETLTKELVKQSFLAKVSKGSSSDPVPAFVV